MLTAPSDVTPHRAATPCRILLLIPSLEAGGAERQLIALAKALNDWGMAITVATFYAGGRLWSELAGHKEVVVLSLGKKPGVWNLPMFVLRLWQLVRTVRPDVIHGYMSGGPNELTLVMGKVSGARTVWGLRASDVDTAVYGRLSSVIFRVGATLSKWPDLIIVNSEAGRRHHLANGYRGDRMRVIRNGIDTSRFRPDPAAGPEYRREWGITPGAQVIGLVARIDPMKDHPTFLEAAALMVRRRPETRFVCVGSGPRAQCEYLLVRTRALGLENHVVWSQERSDLERLYNAFDLATSASAFGEGFSNALGEAMSCGVPCVATDVGDAAIIVGPTGAIVPPRDPVALADAWERMLSLAPHARRTLGQEARTRMVERFSLAVFARDSVDALSTLCGQRAALESMDCPAALVARAP